MRSCRSAAAGVLLAALHLAWDEPPVGAVKKVLNLQNAEVPYPTDLAQILAGPGPGRKVVRDAPVGRGQAVLTMEGAQSHVRLLKGETEVFLFANTEVRFDSVNLWLMRRGATYLVNKRGKLELVVAGIERVFVGSSVYLEVTDAGLLAYVVEGEVLLGAAGEPLPLRSGQAGRVTTEGVRRRAELGSDELARIRARIQAAERTLSPGRPSAGVAALALLGLGAGGAGVYLATRKPDLEVEGSGAQGLCFVQGGQVSVMIRNRGASDAGPSTTLVRFPDGSSLPHPTAEIPAHGSVNVALDVTNMSGACFQGRIAVPGCPVQVVADVNDEVKEADEGNNQASGMCSPQVVG